MRKSLVLGKAAFSAVRLPTFIAGNLPTNRVLHGLLVSRRALRKMTKRPLLLSIQFATSVALELGPNVRVVVPDVAKLIVERESQKISPPGGQTSIARARNKRDGNQKRSRSQSQVANSAPLPNSRGSGRLLPLARGRVMATSSQR